MPSRIIREDILTSSRVDELDPPAEVFYRRLLSKCDDHGLYDARPAILRASLFPLRIDRVREADCSRWMAACQKAGLIVLYSHDGRPYLQVLNTRWTARSEPKYPTPASANNCTQPETTVPVVVVVDVVESVGVGSPRPSRGKQAKRPMPEDFKVSERVKNWAAEKGHGRLMEHLESFKAKCAANGYTYADWDAAFMEAIRNNWAKLPTASVTPIHPHKTVAQAMAPTETKLQRHLGWLRNQMERGQITADEYTQQAKEARERHGEC